MRLKLIGELSGGTWKAVSGNEYVVDSEGILEIPDAFGADCDEAKNCGLFVPAGEISG